MSNLRAIAYGLIPTIIIILFALLMVFLFMPTPAAASNFEWSIFQGCGSDEGRHNIYRLNSNLFGEDMVEATVAVVDQGGNALVISQPSAYMFEGINTLVEVYLDVDSFVTFRVTVHGESQVMTVRYGDDICEDGWRPGALEVEVSAPAGQCFYAHVIDDNGVFLLTDSTYPNGIIWKATDGGFVELILDAYGNPDAGAYLLTPTSC